MDQWSKGGGKFVGQALRAKALANKLNISPEEVIQRWKQGLRWTKTSGWQKGGRPAWRNGAESARQARQKALADGLCGSCHRLPLATKSHCEPCRQKHNERARRRRQESR